MTRLSRSRPAFLPLPIAPHLEGAVAVTAMMGLYTITLYGTTIYLARALGSSQYGVYAVVVATTAMVGALATPGVDQLLARDVAIYRNEGRHDLLRGLIQYSTRRVLLLATILTLALCVAAGLVYGPRPSSPLMAMLLGSLLIPIGALARTRAAVLAGLGHVALSRLPELVLRPTVLFAVAATMALVAGPLRASHAVVATVLAGLLSYLVGTVLLSRFVRRHVAPARPAVDPTRWRKAAIPFFAYSMTDIINSQVGVVLVQGLRTSEEAGQFAVATRGAGIVIFGFAGVAAAMAPATARLWSQGRPHELLRLMRRMIAFSVAFALPVTLVLIVYARDLIGIFGTEYAGATTAFALLCVGQLVYATTGVCGTVLLVTGQERFAAGTMVLCLVVGLGLDLLLIPQKGVEGAAVASVASLALSQVILVTGLARRWHRIWALSPEGHLESSS